MESIEEANNDNDSEMEFGFGDEEDGDSIIKSDLFANDMNTPRPSFNPLVDIQDERPKSS